MTQEGEVDNHIVLVSGGEAPSSPRTARCRTEIKRLVALLAANGATPGAKESDDDDDDDDEDAHPAFDLGMMSFHDEGKKCIAQEGGIKLLVALLAANGATPRAKEGAAFALLGMLAGNDDDKQETIQEAKQYKKRIAQEGGIRPLVTLFAANGTTPDAKEYAALTLGYLASNDGDNKKRIA